MTETWSEWREHDGGECPVGRTSIVQIRYPDGLTSTKPLMAIGLRWDHTGEDDDIVAYRVLVQSHQAPEPQQQVIVRFSDHIHSADAFGFAVRASQLSDVDDHTHYQRELHCTPTISPKTLDEIKARATDEHGSLWNLIDDWRERYHNLESRLKIGNAIEAVVGTIADQAYEAGRRDVNGYVQCRCDALQDALKGAHDLLMQAAITGQRVVFDAALGDYMLAAGETPPVDPFQPSRQAPAPKPADAYMAHGDKIGVHAPTPAAATLDRMPHGIGRVWRNGGIGEMPR